MAGSGSGTTRRPQIGRPWPLLAALILAAGVVLVYWRLLLTNRVLGAGDAFTYFTPYRDYANAVLRSGRLPLWNPYLFLGAPFLANPQTAVLYPLHWPFIWLPAAKSLVATLALHVWIAGLGATIYVRRVAGLPWLAAITAGLVFGLSGFLGARAGQANQLSAVAWLPWLLWLLEESAGRFRKTDERGMMNEEWGTPSKGNVFSSEFITHHLSFTIPHATNLLALAGLAVVVALQFLAGHTQSSFINLAGLALAAVWPGAAALLDWCWRRVRRRGGGLDTGLIRVAAKRLGLAVAAIVLGGMLAAVQLLPTWELARQSIRSGGLSYREAISFSLQPRHLLLTLLPTYGDNLAGRFGTPAFAEFVAYTGVAALVLAGLALLRARQSRPGTLLASPFGLAVAFTVIGFTLALGVYNPLYYGLYKLVPGFDLFRAPARWMILYTFGVSVMAGYGVAGGCEAPRNPKGVVGGWRVTSGGWWSRAVLVVLALGVGGLLALQIWPNGLTVGLWLLAGIATLVVAVRINGRWRQVLLAALVLAELAAASLALDHTRPTAPEAVTSLRTAPSHLLAASEQARASNRLPGRFLSLSGITYDPGDLGEIQQMLGDQLPPQAVYDFVVASKLQEIVAPNLPLLWRLPAVDGYDGGVLPLRRYVDLQTLFIPKDRLEPDGRLREQLDSVPPSRLLRLLGVEHVITDKGFDVWVDGVYYDLELASRLAPGQSVTLSRTDRLEATGLGVFSHLEGASGLPTGTPVAEVEVVSGDGSRKTFTLDAGEDTAEGAWTDAAGHPQPAARQPWPRGQAGWDYLARRELSAPTTPAQIVVRNVAPAGALVLRGISLIDERTKTHAALTMPADGDFQRVHSGDVKVYQNLASLPRADLVGQAQVVADDAAALAALSDPGFDPATEAVLLHDDLARAGLLAPAGDLSSRGEAGRVTVVSDEPERIALQAEAAANSLLVLSDTWYPGWQATVDGQPAPILRANYLFRGVFLPAGSHEVVFAFQPASLRSGAWISLAGVGIVIVLVIAGRRARRNMASSG